MATEGGAIGVDGGIDAIATEANTVLRDEFAQNKIEDEVRELRSARTIDKCVLPFVSAWAKL